MAYVIRRGRAYEYRSIRRGGRVTSEYVGGGSISAECAGFFRELEAGRRIERAMIRADWEEERGRLDEVERAIVGADAACEGVATAALVAAGFHRPQRGRWRRRRDMKTNDGGAVARVDAPTDDTPIDTAAEMSDLLDRIERAEGPERDRLEGLARKAAALHVKESEKGGTAGLPLLRVVLRRRPDIVRAIPLADTTMDVMAATATGKDKFAGEILLKQMQDLRAEVAGPDPSPLERLLAERVAMTWFDVTIADHRWANIQAEGYSTEKGEYHSRYRSRANQRFLAACKSLATVRRLALPVLSVNLGMPGAAEARVPGHRATVGKCLGTRVD